MAPTDIQQQCWLVLLPCPTSSSSVEALRTLYEPGLTQVLKTASHAYKGAMNTVVLDIAVVHDDYLSGSDEHMVNLFPYVQKIVGLMYALICSICTKESIDIQHDNDIDARVALFGMRPQEHINSLDNTNAYQYSLAHLQTLAQCKRPWKRLFCLKNESGEVLCKVFQQIRNNLNHECTERLKEEELLVGPSMISFPATSPSLAIYPEQCLHSHSSVAVGGTFDHLHAGHKLLLTMTALLLDCKVASTQSRGSLLTVGITGDELLKKKQFLDELLDWDTRQASVRQFLLDIVEMSFPSDTLKTSQRISCPSSGARSFRDEFESGLVINYVELFDPFGPTVTDEAISALVISKESRAGGTAVNEKRQAQGWPPLAIFEVDVLDAENTINSEEKETFQGKISSTEIRRRLHEKSAGRRSMNDQNT